MQVFQNEKSILTKLLPKNEPFSSEKEIQELVEKNLSHIFENVEFLKSEYSMDDFRIDTIAFDNEKKSFVIIEYKYKNKKSSSLEQVLSYYMTIMENPVPLLSLYSKVKHVINPDDINMAENRIIFISSEFSTYQKKASAYDKLPTELYEIKKYPNNIITLDRIDKKQSPKINQDKPSDNYDKQNKLFECNEEDYLAGKYNALNPPQEMIELWNELKNRINDKFDKIEFKQRKKYGGFYSIENNSCVCTISIYKPYIKLCYSTYKKDFFPNSENFIDHSDKGVMGVGGYSSDIKNTSNIDKAMPFLEKIYQHKT